MPYVVVIARQRSGTSAFAQLVSKALGLESHGEILDPGSRSPAISETERVATWPKLSAFLQKLHEDEALHLLDIKVSSLNAVSEPFRSPILPPRIIALLQQHKSKVIRLHRHPTAQWVSGLIAEKTGVWHQLSKAEAITEKVRIDPFALENFLITCAKEDALLAEWLDGLPVLHLPYDRVFANAGFPETVLQVASFLGRAPRPDWEFVQPDNQKIAKPSLAENIENLSDVACYLPLPETVHSGARPPAEPGPGIRLDDFDGSSQGRIKTCAKVLDQFAGSGLLGKDIFRDKLVLDWECGDGAFAVAFALAGARLVVGSDQWLDVGRLPPVLRASPQFRFRRAAIEEIESELAGSVDLAFANTVTEHLPDLPGSFASLFRAIKPGGYLFLNHDNYYQPVGSHDHGFLRYGGNEIVRQGPACWEHGADCSLSKDHRDRVSESLPWTWDRRNEENLSPPVCVECHYYRRSQPWAHLLYQDSFANLFPQDGFSTGKPKSSLNKVTIFQLRQFLIEAGFEIEKEERALVANQPPDALLQGQHQFTTLDLRTGMYRVLARRRPAT